MAALAQKAKEITGAPPLKDQDAQKAKEIAAASPPKDEDAGKSGKDSGKEAGKDGKALRRLSLRILAFARTHLGSFHTSLVLFEQENDSVLFEVVCELANLAKPHPKKKERVEATVSFRSLSCFYYSGQRYVDPRRRNCYDLVCCVEALSLARI